MFSQFQDFCNVCGTSIIRPKLGLHFGSAHRTFFKEKHVRQLPAKRMLYSQVWRHEDRPNLEADFSQDPTIPDVANSPERRDKHNLAEFRAVPDPRPLGQRMDGSVPGRLLHLRESHADLTDARYAAARLNSNCSTIGNFWGGAATREHCQSYRNGGRRGKGTSDLPSIVGEIS